MSSEALSAAEMPKKYLEALGKRMAYVETPGPAGAPTVLFLHGNPTSSYIWRNIMPHLAGRARLLAPDLIGMGASDKLDDPGPDSYGFFTHMRYLDAFIAAAAPEDKIVLVTHDWGSALGFHWAARFPKRMLGIAYMEALVTPLRWADWPAASQGVFQALRSEAGEEMVLENNFFVERILPASVLRDLTEEEMNIYRRPYVFPGEDRRPTLSWPRELPIGEEPEDVIGVVNNYARFMSASDMPKLLISADPGAILTGRQLSFCHKWPNQTEVTVRGGHFLQEDSPHEIGEAIAGWMNDLMR